VRARSTRWLAAALALLLVAGGARAETLTERVERMERELQELKTELKRRNDADAAREARDAEAARKAAEAKAAEAATPPATASAAATASERYPKAGAVVDTVLDRVKLGGYGSFRYEGSSLAEQKNTFTYRRFVLTTDANIAPRLHAYMELEFERFRELELEKEQSRQEGGLTIEQTVEGTADSEISFEQGWLQFDMTDWLKFRGGAVLVPVGRFNLNHDDNRWDIPRRSLVDRGTPALPVTAAWDELGVGFLGDIPIVPPTQKLDYQFYVVNGVALDSEFEQIARTRSPESPETAVEVKLQPATGTFGSDVKDAKAVTGRLAWSPAIGQEIGGSWYWGQYTPDVLGNQALWTLALDGLSTYGPFELEAEGVFTRFEGTGKLARRLAQVARDSVSETENPDLNTEVEFELAGLAKNKYGYWLEGRYRFWPEFLTPTPLGRYFDNPQLVAVVRGEQVFLDGLITEAEFGGGVLEALGRENRMVNRFTVGLAYRPVPLVVFSVAYELTWTNRGTSLASVTNFLPAQQDENLANIVLVGAAFGF
jgi:hypothetical protein